MGNKTALHSRHLAAGAKIVDFGGWDMPLHYGSQVQEHQQVRTDAGLFDVSHMTVVDLQGKDARPYLRHLLANDVDKLRQSGKALYSCMLNEQGGVIDDLIVYYLDDQNYRIVVNAATRAKDLAWMQRQIAGFDAVLTERDDLSMIAAQGPSARDKVLGVLSSQQAALAETLTPFTGVMADELFIARTGYTGEDGFECIATHAVITHLWDNLISASVAPCGLGARDTLRLEAGMNLYGADMTEETTPLESGLSWTVAMEPAARDFVGRPILEKQLHDGVKRRLVGLVLLDKGVLRNHQRVLADGLGEGEITSGSFSPTLKCSIAFARVPAGVGNTCQVDIRGKLTTARIVKPPFVRNGKSCLTVG